VKPIKPKRCECHDEPMTWVFDTRYKRGGYFRCYIRDAETTRAWREKNPAKRYLQVVDDLIVRKKRTLEEAT
jgi:hypothetical protein